MSSIDKAQCINHWGNLTLFEIKNYTNHDGKIYYVSLCPMCIRKLDNGERVNLHNFMPTRRPQEHNRVVDGQSN